MSELVLVTGAGGFLGSHIVKQLLYQGYNVRGTVRDLQDLKKVEPLRKLPTRSLLELVEVDLMDKDLWRMAVKDCTFVIHTASPVPVGVPKDESEVVEPAVEGVNNLFKACYRPDSTVKRIVMTSSLAAVSGDNYENDRIYTEDDYASPDNAQAYTKSKILSEKAAWDFVKEKQDCFELVVINPGFIIGPLITNSTSASMEPVKMLLNKKTPFLANVYFPGVDVRDVANAHIVALKCDKAVGHRHICVGDDGEAYPFKMYAEWLKEEFGPKGYNVTLWVAPDWFIKLIGFFEKRAKFLVPLLSKKPGFSSRRMVDVLEINELMSVKDSFIEQAYSMIEKGFIVDKL